MSETSERRNSQTWALRDLRRPFVLVTTITSFALALPITFIVVCNVHEVGHVLVAVPLGWRVDRVRPCLPSGGGVEYSHIGTWAGNAQGYAGGAFAALVVVCLYWLCMVRGGRPHRSRHWWAVGLAGSLLVGPQIVISAVEGTSAAGEDYGERFNDMPALVGLLFATALIGAVAHTWYWARRGRPGDSD